MPQTLRSSVEYMNTSEKIIFILGRFNCEYADEWIEIYEGIVNFIYFMNHEFRHLAVTMYNNM